MRGEIETSKSAYASLASRAPRAEPPPLAIGAIPAARADEQGQACVRGRSCPIGEALLARDDVEDLGDLLAQRPLTVALELILERCVRLYADRLNRRLGETSDSDLHPVEEDEDLAQIVMLLCEIVLEAEEGRSGLAVDPLTGEMRSRELVEERAPTHPPNSAAPPP